MDLALQQTLLEAIESHKSGKLNHAERLYRAVLEADPKQPENPTRTITLV